MLGYFLSAKRFVRRWHLVAVVVYAFGLIVTFYVFTAPKDMQEAQKEIHAWVLFFAAWTAAFMGYVNWQLSRESKGVEILEASCKMLAHNDEVVQMAGIFKLRHLADTWGAEYTRWVLDVISLFIRQSTTKFNGARQEAINIFLQTGAYAHMRPIFEGGDYAGIIFDSSLNLIRANFSNARFADTIFYPEANLSGANFTGVQADSGLVFGDSINLLNANFRDAKLTNIVFGDYTNLENADFSGAWLTGAEFYDFVQLKGAKFIGANLTNAIFGVDVNFNGADFTDAVIQTGTYLSGDFIDCKFKNADLRGCVFTAEAILKGANFYGANMSNGSLDNVKTLAGVIGLPSDIIDALPPDKRAEIDEQEDCHDRD